MVKKCHTYGIKNIFVAGLVYTTGIGLPILERTHEMNDHLCNKLGKCFLTAYIKRGVYLGDGIWVKVFKNGLSKICEDSLYKISSETIILNVTFQSQNLLRQTWKCFKIMV